MFQTRVPVTYFEYDFIENGSPYAKILLYIFNMFLEIEPFRVKLYLVFCGTV